MPKPARCQRALPRTMDKPRDTMKNHLMSTRLFDHIDLRVKNREAAQPFYAQILPAIGFRVDKSGKQWGLFEAEGSAAVAFFGFTEDTDHKPNGNRIAFWAPSRDAVNRTAELIRKA